MEAALNAGLNTTGSELKTWIFEPHPDLPVSGLILMPLGTSLAAVVVDVLPGYTIYLACPLIRLLAWEQPIPRPSSLSSFLSHSTKVP